MTPQAPAPPPPLQGIVGGGLGDGLPRAVLRLVPQGATTAAETATGATTGKTLLAGGALMAAGGSVVLVCLTLKAALDGRQTPLDIADTFYGTHFGDLQGWIQGCYAPKDTVLQGTPARTPELKPTSDPHSPGSPDPGADKDTRRPGRIYVTYTKFNRTTRRSYSGRTSMVIDLNKDLEAQANLAVASRDSNHHINQDENDEPKIPGFLPAVRDEFDVGTAVNYASRYVDVAYWRIRGREQQLIDFHGVLNPTVKHRTVPRTSSAAWRKIIRWESCSTMLPRSTGGSSTPTPEIERWAKTITRQARFSD
ncbi:hypothetical protein ACN28I_22985 [Archangium gephyra]|uniref:hypothetical protein n=1 Tax=Archangium gephyra TaxID=48 RepID=UPI003B7DC1E3